MSDDHDLGRTAEEPSAEDFEAAAEERPRAGVGSVLVRILKSVGVLFVVLALLVYFAIPYYNAFEGVPRGRPGPHPGTRPIPLAPEPTSTPVRRV